jgi:hypothetical protein
MIAILIKALADICDRKAIYQYVHYIIDNDNEPAGHPHWRVRMKTGFRTFGPGRTAWPRPIFQPCNMTRQVPAINDEMRTAYDSERVDVLRYEKKRHKVEEAVHQRGERPLRFLVGHPLALKQVVANRVSNQLIDSKH